MKLAIVVPATKSYLYAWQACIRSIATAASHHTDAEFIFCTDQSDESKEAEKMLKQELPLGWKITTLRLPIRDDEKDYKHAAQLRIAALQGAGFAHARTKARADLCWSVESDNIIPAHGLKFLEGVLALGLYSVAAGTYWNGQFLGGFGTPQTPINEDFTAEERLLKPRLRLCLDACRARPFTPKEGKRIARLMERVKRCPPDGSLWEVIHKYGWRRRGWMEASYAGIGEGAIIPSDWCGLGCTLMDKRALQLADFVGYDGGGTQDLFLCWQRWHPSGLRIACVPHVACDHVKRGPDGQITHHIAYHEKEGECRGHLRHRAIPWVGDPLRPGKDAA